MTLTRVLNQDEAKICEVWMRGIHQAEGQTVLQMSHLVLLMRGLRDYIAEQNQEVIVTAIRTLKEELDFDSTAINHLHLAIYLFQTAVNEVLRMHSIKPHWMFALDNLVRNAVQAAITVLSPELGANLLGQERVQPGGQGPEEGSTSGVSTVNSVKSQKTADSIDNKYWKEYRDQMGALKMENTKLLQELIESQKAYQTLLQQALEEQRAQQSSLTSADTHNSTTLHPDMALVDWLRNLQIDDTSIDRFLYEEYTLEDVLCHVTRDDLRRLNLRGGIELRIWQAILKHKT
ncbi:mitogen-activated protein kinase kinase kinase 15 [Lasius niger]|uniref:Mitogen-activated protein kinase kinase kinase 15 n=1 Tax=Lasius niger TaxID=67767 RepID=A0A0J7KP67_LASNI|nr:mitogen-activated protein kinase kinase kinase 15 [Lasius niger]